MSVAVVVPWRGGCPYRERALAWIRRKLEATGYRVVVAEAPPGPWIKAAAVMPAIENLDEDLVVVHDADVWSPAGLPVALEAVREGAGWAMPHRGVFRLTEASTDQLLDGDRDFEVMALEQPAYLGWEAGGVVVARRETLLDVPMDPRFTGWGLEDESWALALGTLAGPVHRGRAPLAHLWHPPQERPLGAEGRRRGSNPESWRLMMRYAAARNQPDAMRAILEEVTACSPS